MIQNNINVNRISSIKSNDSMNLFSKLALQDNDIINPYEKLHEQKVLVVDLLE